MKEESKKVRDTNFEILRIIAMIMIVTLHYTQNSGVLNNNVQFTLQNIFFVFLNSLCSVGVNCFVIISGYYLITSKFKIQKILHLWGLVLFYSLGIYFFYLITNNTVIEKMSIIDKMYVFTPVLNVHYWFIVPYLALYTIFPFLNKMISSFNQKQLQAILIIFFVLICVINNITPLNQNFEAVGGHSILWFMFLYAVGAYIKKYVQEEKEKDKYKYLAFYIISIIIGFTLTMLFTSMTKLNVLIQFFCNRVMAFNSVFAFIGALSLFLFFKSIHIKNITVNRCISFISKNTFAVYLIHEHQLNRKVIWTTNLNIEVAGMQNYVLHYIISILVIFAACIIIEELRRNIFKGILEIPMFKKLKNRIQEKYNKINEKVYQYLL